MGSPTTESSSTTTTTTTRRSLSSSLWESIWTVMNDPDDIDNELDQVHEYADSDDSDINSSSSSNLQETGQIIVRFDTADTTSITLTRAEIESRAQQVATHLGGTVIQIYEHVFYGATIGNLPSDGTGGMSLLTNDESDVGSSSSSSRGGLFSSGARLFRSPNTDEVPNFSYEPDASWIRGRSISTIYDESSNGVINVQSDAPASLDRINQSTLPLDQTYKYKYDGTGVTVFVVDTGIRSTHVDLQQTSIICGYSAFPAMSNTVDGDCDDENGHGTHVAGTIASQTYGVAKRVNLVTVKVLDHQGGGSFTTLLGGIEFMIEYRNMYPTIPMVANLSLGAGKSDAINDAVSSAVQNNIHMVVAAGNENTDACATSPASASGVITVGASRYRVTSSALPSFISLLFSRLLPSRSQERRAQYSNYGNCVDIFAWGSNVLSLGIASPTSIVSKSGTSMATPHVAGTAALYLHRNPQMTTEEIKQSIIQDASTQQLASMYQKRSPNRTLNTQPIV